MFGIPLDNGLWPACKHIGWPGTVGPATGTASALHAPWLTSEPAGTVASALWPVG